MSSASSAASFAAGETVGDYRITGVLGAGASGEVFEAEHCITRRKDALKILSHGRLHTPEEEQRFLREIQVQASLDHPNITAVRSAFWTGSDLVLAMERVEGESLDSILSRGRIPLETGINYVLQAASALIHAHTHGVIHRDIKPGNMIITPNGTVKLTDFGLARHAAGAHLTDTGGLAGSPYYMSPEQILSGALDARTDVYSLGVVLYEVAAGRRPFESDNAFTVMLGHRDRDPEPPAAADPSIGAGLNHVILTAMAKDPAQRFQSAADFRYALEAAVAADAADRVRAEQPRVRRFSRVQQFVVVAAAATALAAVVANRPGESASVRKETPALPVAPPAPRPVEDVLPVPPEPTFNVAPRMVPRRKPPRPRKASSRPAWDVRVIGQPDAVSKRAPLLPAPPEIAHGQPPFPAAEPPQSGLQTIGSADPALPVPPQAAPRRSRNRLWRALGKIVRPWKSRDDSETGDAPAGH